MNRKRGIRFLLYEVSSLRRIILSLLETTVRFIEIWCDIDVWHVCEQCLELETLFSVRITLHTVRVNIIQ